MSFDAETEAMLDKAKRILLNQKKETKRSSKNVQRI